VEVSFFILCSQLLYCYHRSLPSILPVEESHTSGFCSLLSRYFTQRRKVFAKPQRWLCELCFLGAFAWNFTTFM